MAKNKNMLLTIGKILNESNERLSRLALKAKRFVITWYVITLSQILTWHAFSKFLQISGFKWIDSKEFNLLKYTSNRSKGCFLEIDFEYPKELHELHNDYPNYPRATDKLEIKGEMKSEY